MRRHHGISFVVPSLVHELVIDEYVTNLIINAAKDTTVK
jgi:hypothetical protein